MTPVRFLSTDDDATARRWAVEAGITGKIDAAVASGGKDRIAIFEATIGTQRLLLIAWWGWDNPADNGLSAHRSTNAALIARLVAFYSLTIIPGTEREVEMAHR